MKQFRLFFAILVSVLISNPLIANGPTSYPTEPEGDFTTYFKDGKVIIKSYTGKSTSLTIPEYLHQKKVCEIAQNAFLGNNTIKQISLPASLQKIGNNAFKQCSSLESVTISASGLTLGNGAFAECNQLQEIILPEGIDSIGQYAFANCKRLSKVTVLDTDVIFKYSSDSCNIFNKANGQVENIFFGYQGSSTQKLAESMGYSFSPITNNTTPISINKTHTSSLNIYPTIVNTGQHHMLNISTDPTEIKVELQIYRINGELVLQQTIHQGEGEINLNNAQFTKGVYAVSVYTKTGRQVKKFIIR